MRYHKNNGEEVIVYTNEEREKALEVSLTALASSLGYTPVRQGSHFSLKEMDSLVIYNDRSWKRWSGKGYRTAGSQIDFLLEFGGIDSVPEAIQQLLEFKGEPMLEQYASASREHHSEQDFVLPPKNDNFKRLYAYLIQTRGLSQEVVSDFVHKKLIYEDAVHHNIVYCGYDPEGNIRYAGLRGTADIYGKKFKMDVPGNNKNYGVNIVNPESSEIKVFESVIDCMSYIDLYGDKESNKLILGMVEDNPLAQFLKDYNHIKTITFCLDNDAAAHKALYGDPNQKQPKPGLKEKYETQGYMVKIEIPPYGKDFNESLLGSKKIEAACTKAMELRGYKHIGNVDGKIAFSRHYDKENNLGDTSDWVFTYRNWYEVRNSLLIPPLWEDKVITDQVDRLIKVTDSEKSIRVSEAEIQKCLSGMKALGYTLLDYQKGDLTALTFLNESTGEKIGIDGWDFVRDHIEQRTMFHEDGTLRSEYNGMLQLIKEHEKKVPLPLSECVIDYMTGELSYGTRKKEFMQAYEKAKKWKSETVHQIDGNTEQKFSKKMCR